MTEPYTARHLGWDYTIVQAAREGHAQRHVGQTVHAQGRHADRLGYRITDPSTRRELEMADEDVIA